MLTNLKRDSLVVLIMFVHIAVGEIHMESQQKEHMSNSHGVYSQLGQAFEKQC